MMFSTTASIFAKSDGIEIESEPNNTMDRADGTDGVTETNRIIMRGVVSSADYVDWFKFESTHSGGCWIGIFKNGVDCKLYLYDDQGREMDYTPEYFIDNQYIRKNQTYYVKVEYVSGVPKEPYMLIIDVIE